MSIFVCDYDHNAPNVEHLAKTHFPFYEIIRAKNPETVSLIAMGKAGITPVPEDLLAAEYIKALLEEKPFDIDGRIDYLKDHGGEQFFDPAQAHIFPREDYPLCVAYNQFPFVLRVEMGKMLKICRVDPPFV